MVAAILFYVARRPACRIAGLTHRIIRAAPLNVVRQCWKPPACPRPPNWVFWPCRW